MQRLRIGVVLIPAAQYLRTSRRFQEAYLQRQSTVIAQFAKAHEFRIIRTYEDPARTGMVITPRKGMRQLLLDVLDDRAAYQAILVYDVSRWGRFLDIDESAHYEFLCKSSGVPVYYCNEACAGSNATAALFKSMRRYQAGEFSRELGEKVCRAGKRIAALGFRMGGAAGFGLRRMLVSESGQHLQQLAPGEFKQNDNHKTILVPGPRSEVKTVQNIFAMAATGRMNCQDIADQLNQRGIRFHTGRPWDYYDVRRMLSNPKYIGSNVWGRTSGRFYTPRLRIKPDHWTIKANAFDAVVDPAVFERVQVVLKKMKPRQWSNDDLLEQLRKLLKQKGILNSKLIDQTAGMPSCTTYHAHFGGLRRAYAKIGYHAEKGTFTKIARRDQTDKMRARIFDEIKRLFAQDVTVFRFPKRRRLILRLDNGLSISVVLCRSLRLRGGHIRWRVYPTRNERDYITLLCRLTETNDNFLDFHLFPVLEKLSCYTFASDDPWFMTGKRLLDLRNLCSEAKLLSRLDDSSWNRLPCVEANFGTTKGLATISKSPSAHLKRRPSTQFVRATRLGA